jgi:DNA-binding beta-propeller fold protein YncE
MALTAVSAVWAPSCSGGTPPNSTWHENPQFGLQPSIASSFTLELIIQEGAPVPAALWILEADHPGNPAPMRAFTGFVAKAHSVDDRCSLTVSLARKLYVVFAATCEPHHHAPFKILCTSADPHARFWRLLSTPSESAVQSEVAAEQHAQAGPALLRDEPVAVEPPPRGWRTAFDPKGGMYYFHEVSRRAQYERPSASGEEQALPGGWRVARDERGDEYYWNERTFEAQYEPPSFMREENEDDCLAWNPPLPQQERAGVPVSASAAAALAATTPVELRNRIATMEREALRLRSLTAPATTPASRPGSAPTCTAAAAAAATTVEVQDLGAKYPGFIKNRIAAVEQEALRLRSLLTDAQTEWQKSVKRRLKPRASVAPTEPFAPGYLPAVGPSPKSPAAPAEDQQKEQPMAPPRALERRRQAGPVPSWQHAIMHEQAHERLRAIADAALLECGYADEVLRIRRERRQPRPTAPKPPNSAPPTAPKPPNSAPPTAPKPPNSAPPTAPKPPNSAPPPPPKNLGAPKLPPPPKPPSPISKEEFLRFGVAASADPPPPKPAATGMSSLTGTPGVLSYSRTLGGTCGSRLGQFHGPSYVTLLAGGEVGVADVQNARVQILGAPRSRTSPLEVRRVLGERKLSNKLVEPSHRMRLGRGGLVADATKGLLYAVDVGDGAPGSACLRKLRMSSFDGELSLAVSAEGKLSAPAALALSSDGTRLCVADLAQSQVLVYDAPSLRYLHSLGSLGSARGQLRAPDGVAILDERVYVADTCNHRVAVFLLDGGRGAAVAERSGQRSTGGFVRTFGRFGSTPGRFEFPRGLAIVEGMLLVSETTRVQLLTLEGAPLQVLPLPGAVALRGVCAGGANAYIADYEAHLIHVLHVDPTRAAPIAEEPPPAAASASVPDPNEVRELEFDVQGAGAPNSKISSSGVLPQRVLVGNT